MNALVRGLLDAIKDEPDALAELAAALGPHLLAQPGPEEDRWMNTREAAEYLGLPSANALHKLTAARKILFRQDAPGGKCWFSRRELDEWRLTSPRAK